MAKDTKSFSVFDEARGIEDHQVIQKAYDENWILISNDKDFGEKVYRERQPHRGVIFMRLEDERANNKIEVLRRLLERYAVRFEDQFVVVPKRKSALPNLEHNSPAVDRRKSNEAGACFSIKRGAVFRSFRTSR